jgi:DNA helicase-2/ATP-dependent DNA helicase PcrA
LKFNDNQIKAINKLNGNTAVIAAPGSGKTSVLTNRIVKLIEEYDVNPANILAITFSRKAKENMDTRLKTMINSFSSVNTETFHSLALKIISSKYGSKFKLWDIQWQKEKVITDIIKPISCNPEIDFNEIFLFIKIQKNNMLKPNDKLIFEKTYSYSNENMIKIYKKYEEYKELNSFIEFDDFLNLACEILESDDKILKSYQNRFKYILSDEYQDVSMNQAKLITMLGKNNNVFVVGDMMQAIYGFSGGKSEYLLDFDCLWNNVDVINLDINYRCSKDIVDSANKFAESIPESQHRNYIKSKANNPPYSKPIFTEYENSYEECKGISNKIKELHGAGIPYKDISILARTNAQLQKFESVLHDNRIPFDVVDGKIITDLKEIKLLVGYLKLSNNIYDNDAFREIYNKPNRWLDKKFLSEVENTIKAGDSLFNGMDNIARRNWRYKNGIDEIYKVINYLRNKKFANVKGMVSYIRKRLDIDSFVSKGEMDEDGLSPQIENMDSFEDLCKQFKTVNELNIYLNELKENNERIKDIDSGIKLLTLHKSKGLEFKIVFISGCSDGLLPHRRTLDINEEKRLFYVGITRAEQELFLSHSSMYNDQVYEISPFIKDLGDTILINNITKPKKRKYNKKKF